MPEKPLMPDTNDDNPRNKYSKRGFLLYTDYLPNIELLSMEERGQLFTSILYHESGKKILPMGEAPMMAFSFIRNNLDRNYEKYLKKIEERRNAGRKGGIAKAMKQNVANLANATFAKHTIANAADNENDNDKDKDNDNVINITATALPVSSKLPRKIEKTTGSNLTQRKPVHTDYNALVMEELLQSINEN